MTGFQISPKLDKNKMFLVNSRELEGRLNPFYYRQDCLLLDKKIIGMKHKKLNQILYPIQNGSTPTGGKFSEDGIIYYRSQDFNLFDIQTNQFITNEFNEVLGRSKVKKGDILLAVVGATLGKVGYLSSNKQSGNINQNVARLRLLNEQEIISEYLAIFLYLSVGQSLLKRQATVTAQPYLNNYELGKIKIPTPSKKIQAQVVAKIQAAYKAKEKKEAEAQALLDGIDDYLLGELGIKKPKPTGNSIKDRIFIRNFRDISGARFDPYFYKPYYNIFQKEFEKKNTIKPLSELLKQIESGSRPAGGVSNIESGVLSFGGEHVSSGGEITLNKPKYISKAFHKKHQKTETRLKDLLLVKDGATTGKICFIEKLDHAGQNVNEHVFILRANDQVDPFYLFYYLKSLIGQSQIQRHITGATITGITKEVMRKISVILPELQKQKIIIKHIYKIRDKAKKLQEQAVAQLDSAKKQVEEIILNTKKERK